MISVNLTHFNFFLKNSLSRSDLQHVHISIARGSNDCIYTIKCHLTALINLNLSPSLFKCQPPPEVSSEPKRYSNCKWNNPNYANDSPKRSTKVQWYLTRNVPFFNINRNEQNKILPSFVSKMFNGSSSVYGTKHYSWKHPGVFCLVFFLFKSAPFVLGPM